MYIYKYYARNRTHVCLRGGAAACAPIPISHTSIHMPIHTYIKHIHTCIYIYIYIYITHVYIYIYILCAQSHARVHARRCSRMRAHPCLSHKYLYTYTYMYVYLQCMHTYIYKYRHTYTHMRITRLCYAQLCAHTWAPAHARARFRV